jgi:hypothetical protein
MIMFTRPYRDAVKKWLIKFRIVKFIAVQIRGNSVSQMTVAEEKELNVQTANPLAAVEKGAVAQGRQKSANANANANAKVILAYAIPTFSHKSRVHFPGVPIRRLALPFPECFCLPQAPIFVQIYLKIKCANCMSSIPPCLPILPLAFSTNMFPTNLSHVRPFFLRSIFARKTGDLVLLKKDFSQC